MNKTEGPNMGSLETKRSLNELETVDFLLQKGAKRLEEFKPNTPVFYVFEDMFRGRGGPFGHMPVDKRPSLAVVHNPIKLDFNAPLAKDELDPNSTRVVYELFNDAGRVDLYAINPVTHELVLVDTENKTKKYHVRKDRIFEALDGVVPS